MDTVNRDDVITLRKGTVESLGDFMAAGLYDLMARRCAENGGEWRISIADLTEHVWLSNSQTRRALKILLSRGWIAVRQYPGYDRTGIYRVIPRDPTQHM